MTSPPPWGGILFTTLGLVLIFDKTKFIPGMLLGIGVMLLAGLVWAGWKARQEANK